MGRDPGGVASIADPVVAALGAVTTGDAGSRPVQGGLVDRAHELARRLPVVVAAVLLPVLVLTGCGAGDGLRVENGQQPTLVSPEPTSPTPKKPPSSFGVMRDKVGEDGTTKAIGVAVGLNTAQLRALLLTDGSVDGYTKGVLRTCAQCIGRGLAADLTGEGVQQRIVTVKVLSTGWAFVAYLIGDVDGVPKVRSAVRGQDIRITSAKDLNLVVSSKVYGPIDRACCPSGSKVEIYRWNGSYLVQKSEQYFPKGS